MRWRPMLAVGAAFGAVLWLTGWLLSHSVDLATNRGLLGLTEGQTRALLNPGLVLLSAESANDFLAARAEGQEGHT